jgi:Flp pilus assembly protein TadD
MALAIRTARTVVFAALMLTLAGCGEPSRREVDNARAFEALLTSVTMTNARELEKNATRIEQRHEAEELSDARYKVLREIIEKARANDWVAAEKQAYEFRAEFGDHGSYFK